MKKEDKNKQGNEPMTNMPITDRQNCPNCGGSMTMTKEHGKWLCSYCQYEMPNQFGIIGILLSYK